MIDDPPPPRSRSALVWIAGIGLVLIAAAVIGYVIASGGTVPGISNAPEATVVPPGLNGTPAAGVMPGAAGGGRPTPDLAALPPRFDRDEAETERLDFQPAMPAGDARVGGICERESALAPRADAYHCVVDNQPYDPCYAVAGDDKLVICGARPTFESTAFLLRLIEPPPASRGGDPPEEPWVVEVGDTICERRLGLNLVTFGGKPIRYDCRDGSLIVDLDRDATTWAAQRVTIRIEDQPLADSAEWVPVSRAWW